MIGPFTVGVTLILGVGLRIADHSIFAGGHPQSGIDCIRYGPMTQTIRSASPPPPGVGGDCDGPASLPCSVQ